MTSQSPRIYLYKITFEEVSYYYYGVKKEKYFNEEYWGSPYTHRGCWDFYTPKKQILQLFDYTDEGWLKALEVEKRVIKQFYNTDKWCLNENVGGLMSLEINRKSGKKSAKTNKKQNTAIFGLTKKQLKEQGILGGKKSYELGVGIHSLTPEQIRENSKKGGQKAKELGVGLFSKDEAKIKTIVTKINETNKKNGTGIYSITSERKKEIVKRTNSQRWMCLETGYITTSGPLTKYQRARGISTLKRVRIV